MTPSKLEKAYKYCEAITKTHAKSFYFAAKFLPRHKQKVVYPIYAFCRTVDDEIDESAEIDRSKAVQSVQSWEAKLKDIYEKRESAGQTAADERQNLILSAWRDILKNYEIPQNLPLELIQGILMDTEIKRYETFAELYVYCYRVASTVGLMASEILGYSDAKALRYAEAMGVGMQLTNILRDLREDALMGRIYLPQEDLRRFDISEQQIFAGEMSQRFVEMMKFQIARARDFYREGERGIGLLEKDSRFTVLLASRIYGKILDEIERQNYDVFKRRARTTKVQKVFAIPKIWREAKSK